MIIILNAILFILLILILTFNLSVYLVKRQRIQAYHIHIKFVGGNKIKLVLNDEQYEHLKNVLNQSDGFFEIGDEQDSVKIYREHICSVEVKRK